MTYILVPYLMRLVCFEAETLRFFVCVFQIKLPLNMADANGRSDACVVKLTLKDILAHLQLLSGKKDAWNRQVNLEN